ncbi:MAG: hypothetical protein AAF587_28750 [Bacteroidota bacterium]
MDIFQKVRQIEKQINQLEERLAELKTRREQAQDDVIRRVTQEAISQIIDAIDQARQQLEKEQAKLPQKRTNGHHPPESMEDSELPIDQDVSSKGESPSDN